MKAFAIVLLALMVSNAHANWIVSKCSNSDGTVTWETGSEQDLINLKYAHFVEGTLTLNVEQVSIEFTKEITIREKSFRSCTYSNHTRVYAGKVKITPADKHPHVLRSLFPSNKVETEVICTVMINSQRDC
jgi:hypothetical protein